VTDAVVHREVARRLVLVGIPQLAGLTKNVVSASIIMISSNLENVTESGVMMKPRNLAWQSSIFSQKTFRDASRRLGAAGLL
jgi:hypothetical protein